MPEAPRHERHQRHGKRCWRYDRVSREVLDLIVGPGGTGDNKSSLCLDILKRRPTEIDVINGAVVTRGKRYGIATPINATLVALVKGLESHYLAR